jgi:3-dehydroquinate synthase
MSPDFRLGEDCAIFVGNLSQSFPSWLAQKAYSKVFLITDVHCNKLCLPLFLEKGQIPLDIPHVVIAAGESQKNLSTCATVWKAMLEQQLDRKALVINLGGGVVGDLGGFCAATWKRGVDFVQVPTTLLSMTDAAIGGKTGVDFEGLKNSIGVFQQPCAVFADPGFLSTLPAREQRSGLAEVIKHAFIGDMGLLDLLEDGLDAAALRRSIAVKVRIVQEDPLERGMRMLLNYGHSIGHALESYFLESPKPLTHGEAIAIGMVLERWAVDSDNAEKTREICRAYFPHVPIPESAIPQLWDWLKQDKKNQAGKVRMALPGETPFSMRIAELELDRLQAAVYWWNANQNLRFSR